MNTKGWFKSAMACATLLSSVSVCRSIYAQSTIRQPGEHPDYSVELEPHFALGAFDPPGNTIAPGFGGGLRLTIPVVKQGFIASINNSIGISFGFDWLHYSGNDVTIGPCAYFAPGPAGTLICTQVAGFNAGPASYLFFPVAMQWNFWLHERFSAFGEPGLAIYYRKAQYYPGSDVSLTPVFDLGGRWHFSKVAALTFRLGYPVFTLGVSFFL